MKPHNFDSCVRPTPNYILETHLSFPLLCTVFHCVNGAQLTHSFVGEHLFRFHFGAFTGRVPVSLPVHI